MKTHYRDAILYGALMIAWGVAGAWAEQAHKIAISREWKTKLYPRLVFMRQQRERIMDEEFTMPETVTVEPAED